MVQDNTPTEKYFALEALAEEATRLRRRTFSRLWRRSTKRWIFTAADHPYAWLRTRDSHIRMQLERAVAQESASDSLRTIIAAEFPGESFAIYAQRKLGLTSEDVEKLKGIHEKRGEWLEGMRVWLTPQGQVAVFIAAIAVLGDRVPEEAVNRIWNYSSYKLALFLLLLSSIVVVAAGWLLWRTNFYGLKRAHALCGLVLMYLSGSDGPSGTASIGSGGKT